MYKFEIMFKSVMQHYPLEPVGNHYPTATFPTAEAILRGIANAMGLKLESEEEYASFKEKFTFDVKSEKADHPVTVYTDFEEDPETDTIDCRLLASKVTFTTSPGFKTKRKKSLSDNAKR